MTETDDDQNAALRHVILGQTAEGIAIPVLLHGPGAEVTATPEAYLAQSAAGQRLLAGGEAEVAPDGVIAANIHDIPPAHRAEAEARLRALARLGPPLDLTAAAPASGRRIFVGFYDGFRDTAFWGARMCADLGLRAWFFPIFTGIVPGQAELDDQDLARLATDHEIGFHSHSHLGAADINEANLLAEVLRPIARISAITGRPPLLAAWRGGGRFDQDQLADRTLQSAGVRFLVSNWSIEAIGPGATQTVEPRA